MKAFTLYKRAADTTRLSPDAEGYRDRPLNRAASKKQIPISFSPKGELHMNNTLRMFVSLAAAWLWSCEANAYQLRAIENSFLGTNSTSAPEIHWLRYREGNGSASISVTSDGSEGVVKGSLSLQRVSADATSVASAIYNFRKGSVLGIDSA